VKIITFVIEEYFFVFEPPFLNLLSKYSRFLFSYKGSANELINRDEKDFLFFFFRDAVICTTDKFTICFLYKYVIIFLQDVEKLLPVFFLQDFGNV